MGSINGLNKKVEPNEGDGFSGHYMRPLSEQVLSSPQLNPLSKAH